MVTTTGNEVEEALQGATNTLKEAEQVISSVIPAGLQGAGNAKQQAEWGANLDAKLETRLKSESLASKVLAMAESMWKGGDEPLSLAAQRVYDTLKKASGIAEEKGGKILAEHGAMVDASSQHMDALSGVDKPAHEQSVQALDRVLGNLNSFALLTDNAELTKDVKEIRAYQVMQPKVQAPEVQTELSETDQFLAAMKEFEKTSSTPEAQAQREKEAKETAAALVSAHVPADLQAKDAAKLEQDDFERRFAAQIEADVKARNNAPITATSPDIDVDRLIDNASAAHRLEAGAPEKTPISKALASGDRKKAWDMAIGDANKLAAAKGDKAFHNYVGVSSEKWNSLSDGKSIEQARDARLAIMATVEATGKPLDEKTFERIAGGDITLDSIEKAIKENTISQLVEPKAKADPSKAPSHKAFEPKAAVQGHTPAHELPFLSNYGKAAEKEPEPKAYVPGHELPTLSQYGQEKKNLFARASSSLGNKFEQGKEGLSSKLEKLAGRLEAGVMETRAEHAAKRDQIFNEAGGKLNEAEALKKDARGDFKYMGAAFGFDEAAAKMEKDGLKGMEKAHKHQHESEHAGGFKMGIADLARNIGDKLKGRVSHEDHTHEGSSTLKSTTVPTMGLPAGPRPKDGGRPGPG